MGWFGWGNLDKDKGPGRKVKMPKTPTVKVPGTGKQVGGLLKGAFKRKKKRMAEIFGEDS